MAALQGTAASDGIAIGKAFILEAPDLSFSTYDVDDVVAEKERFQQALAVSKQELEKIRGLAAKNMGEEQAKIFSAHLLILEDPEVVDPIIAKITEEAVNAETALEQLTQQFIDMFEAMDNDYMKERAADLRDVTRRVLAHLLNVTFADPALIDEEVVVIAHDLTPSDTAQLDKQFVQGFATDIGGRTSHSAIMARSLEIPAIVGMKDITEKVSHGEEIILNGDDGTVIISPHEAEKQTYQEKKRAFLEKKAALAQYKNEPTITQDQVQVELVANIGTPEDVSGVLGNGGEGVGLYRTEFLYMGQSELPSEEKQFAAYKDVLEQMGRKQPVVVRTLDIGGDKKLPYLDLPDELNPFLGHRAIRFCLEHDDIFRTQLRALLRASVYGSLKIMFPMIATITEFREAKAICLEEKAALQQEGIEVADDIELGIMVEIPSTAVTAAAFAPEVDFFSIGTNDLIQYTMAADRMNEKVSYLYQPYHPAILNLVDQVITAAHSKGKWVGMCGEMAGDQTAIPLLLALGLDEFSMSASAILPAREQIRGLSQQKLAAYRSQFLQAATSDEVRAIVKEMTH